MRMQKSADGILGWGQGGEPKRTLTEGPNIEQRDQDIRPRCKSMTQQGRRLRPARS